MKSDNFISISWTPAHTNSDDPLAQGNAEADKLAARGCAAPPPLDAIPTPRPRPPELGLSRTALLRPRSRRRSEVPLARGRSECFFTPQRDPRLPPFDSRQPVSWRAFFRRLALIFLSLTLPALPVHDFNGDLVGD